MLHATWSALEKSPFKMGLYRTYRQLPDVIRGAARWILMPRWQLLCAAVTRRAQNRVQSGPFAGMSSRTDTAVEPQPTWLSARDTRA